MHQPGTPKTDNLPDTSDRRTLDYYQHHAQEYIARTANLPLGRLQKMLAAVLPPQATILDLGCGSGRDLAFFRRCGFTAIGIDYIPAFAKASSRYAPVIRGDITRLPFADCCFDGIWACAVLLHLTPAAVLRALTEIRRVSKGGAGVLISVKKGQGEMRDSDGRYFCLFDQTQLQSLLAQGGIELVVIEESQDHSGTNWLDVLGRIPLKASRPAVRLDIAAALVWGQKILGAVAIAENIDESQWLLEDNFAIQQRAALSPPPPATATHGATALFCPADPAPLALSIAISIRLSIFYGN